jgi:hypothetical protein
MPAVISVPDACRRAVHLDVACWGVVRTSVLIAASTIDTPAVLVKRSPLRYARRTMVKFTHQEHSDAHRALEGAIRRHEARAVHPDLGEIAQARERRHAHALRKVKEHLSHGEHAIKPAG